MCICNASTPLSRLPFPGWLGSESKLRRTRKVEDDELRFEEDIAEDRESNSGIRLDTAEASCNFRLACGLNPFIPTTGKNLLLPLTGA